MPPVSGAVPACELGHGYHVTSVHWNYAVTTGRRKQLEKSDAIRAMDAGGWAKQGGGFHSFENGHLLL
jgi:benzoate/toluate 1,2-dioxygenase subunit alpha